MRAEKAALASANLAGEGFRVCNEAQASETTERISDTSLFLPKSYISVGWGCSLGL